MEQHRYSLSLFAFVKSGSRCQGKDANVAYVACRWAASLVKQPAMEKVPGKRANPTNTRRRQTARCSRRSLFRTTTIDAASLPSGLAGSSGSGHSAVSDARLDENSLRGLWNQSVRIMSTRLLCESSSELCWTTSRRSWWLMNIWGQLARCEANYRQ